MSVDLIMYKYVSSCKITTCEGSMSINGTIQVSFLEVVDLSSLSRKQEYLLDILVLVTILHGQHESYRMTEIGSPMHIMI